MKNIKKRLLIAGLLLVSFSVTNAQTYSETEIVRGAFKLEKRVVVSEFLGLNDSLAKKFWPIYDKYEIERNAISDRRIKLMESYAKTYKNMEAVTAEKLYKESGSIQKADIALREKYASQIKKNVSATAAFKWFIVEDYIITAIKNEMYNAIPAPINK